MIILYLGTNRITCTTAGPLRTTIQTNTLGRRCGIHRSFLIGDTKVISLDEVFPGDWLCDQSLNDPCSLHCSGFVSGVSGLGVWLVMLIPSLGAPPPTCHGVMVDISLLPVFISAIQTGSAPASVPNNHTTVPQHESVLPPKAAMSPIVGVFPLTFTGYLRCFWKSMNKVFLVLCQGYSFKTQFKTGFF